MGVKRALIQWFGWIAVSRAGGPPYLGLNVGGLNAGFRPKAEFGKARADVPGTDDPS